MLLVLRRPSALVENEECHWDGSQKLVEDECLHKNSCVVKNDPDALGVRKCPGVHWDMRLVATAKCS